MFNFMTNGPQTIEESVDQFIYDYEEFLLEWEPDISIGTSVQDLST